MDIKQGEERYTPLMRTASFKLDEGFVDDTRSQDDGDSTMGVEPRAIPSLHHLPDPLIALQQAIMELNEAQRTAHVYSILQSLRTSSLAEIVDMLYPRLHIDPLHYLPPELTSLVFAYLPPNSLLEASRVSKAWRERTLDSSLWKRKFIAEGWKLDTAEVARFEQQLTRRRSKNERARKGDVLDQGHISKKRHTLRHEDTGGSSSAQSQGEDMIGVERLTMEPISMASPTSSIHAEGSPNPYMSVPMNVDVDGIPNAMVVSAARSDVRLNYHHVYRQRRRLEENWSAGRYKSFQLPHKDFPEEAHNECVYTIQYSGRYLVSGSRDRTLRIWDLDTQRLVRRPLSGHNGSVLCLQFDASPEEDIVISGSSDTDVIVWQFSTGNMLRRIKNAHDESVLNLKFDKRYLVTCSKDNLIKIWNRHSLAPGDDAYPIRGVGGGAKFPSYILDLSMVNDPRDMNQFFSAEQLAPLPEYSLIMKIDLHAAAVNAVHIYKDELVSASGDRDIKVFNIRTGAQTALCKGHNKGIACVQYDGIRIVSGSSDDTIRIFDPKSQAEVACLAGHSKLVRTVQASFGDQPGDEEELEREARRIDQAVFQARSRGEIPDKSSEWRRRRDRNAGSSRPQDVMATGAHIPPGGGGGPWARIVSGSYDETIIIWRKAKDGRWVAQHTLKQADALKAAGGPLLTRSERMDMAARLAQQQQLAMAQRNAQQNAQHHQMLQMQQAQAAAGILVNPIAAVAPTPPMQLPPLGPPQQAVLQTIAPGPTPVFPPGNVAAVPGQAHHHHHHRHHHALLPGQNARVFKIAFSPLRIVACSQDPKIVIFDFRNGDEDIIACSRFFSQPD